MFGLAVLFGLWVWIVLTLIAMKVGTKMGAQLFPARGSRVGGFLGFMLLMGWVPLYGFAEFMYMQHKTKQLCKAEGVVEVFVSPEAWRKAIGEEEWKKSIYTGNPDENYPSNSKIMFQGREYHIFSQSNQRLYVYVSEDRGNSKEYVYTDDLFFYDFKLKKILYHQRVFSIDYVGYMTNSLFSFLDIHKLWSSYGIQDCNMKEKLLTTRQYSLLIY